MPADSHCHLNNPAFADDLKEVVVSIKEAGIKYLLNVGYDIDSSEEAVKLADEYDFMYAAVGVHPHHASSLDDESIEKLRKLSEHPKVVAFGEMGLDYFRNKSPKEDQRIAFKRQLTLAREIEKPVIIHCRDAMEDTLEILQAEKVDKIGGVMHCFAGTPEDVSKCIELNLYISFAGNITYPKAENLRESLAATPGHRLLMETDSPYLTPQAKRGKRNDSTLLAHVIKQAADTRKVTVEDIERIAVTNFEELFGLYEGAKGEIAYKIRNSLYLNVTARCSNECYFCARYYSNTVQGHNLRLKSDPTVDEMINAVGDPTRYDEIVFCGYGEPTLKLDTIIEVAKAVKAKGGKIRLNSNGHANQIAGKDITPQLKGLIDTMSISLNTADEKTYNEICNPQIPNAWKEVVEFIRCAKREGFDITATAVDIEGKVDIEAVRRLAEDELGVKFRARKYNLVG